MPNTPPQLKAGGTINPSRFVKLDTSADDTGLQSDANARTIGISQEGTEYAPLSDVTVSGAAASSGDCFRLYGEGDVCLLEAGGSVTAGDRLKSDANGRGVSIATSGTTVQQVGAIALQSASGSGVKIKVQVVHFSERPAIA